MLKSLLALWLCCFSTLIVLGQKDTSISISKPELSTIKPTTQPIDSSEIGKPIALSMRGRPFRPSPRKATMLAVALPGAGQFYNKSYWKIPIVYVGFITFAYFIVSNDREYRNYRDAYILRYKGDLTSASYYDKYKNIKTLSLIRENYRRNRDFSIILTGAWYAITIIDAAVDAHLYNFNVTDDISASIRPKAQANPDGSISAGLGINFTIR